MLRGGYSYGLNFWWHYQWPLSIQQRTLKFFIVKVKDYETDTLISINLLEYATVIITYAAATTALLHDPSPYNSTNPYPTLLNLADNTSALSWMRKAANSTPSGRALSRILCAIQINNKLGLNGGFISSVDNIVADKISRLLPSASSSTPSYALLFKEFPKLAFCRKFQLGPELQSCLLHALLSDQKVDLPLPKILGHFEPANATT